MKSDPWGARPTRSASQWSSHFSPCGTWAVNDSSWPRSHENVDRSTVLEGQDLVLLLICNMALGKCMLVSVSDSSSQRRGLGWMVSSRIFLVLMVQNYKACFSPKLLFLCIFLCPKLLFLCLWTSCSHFPICANPPFRDLLSWC